MGLLPYQVRQAVDTSLLDCQCSISCHTFITDCMPVPQFKVCLCVLIASFDFCLLLLACV